MVRYIDSEILDQVAAVQGEMKKSGETPRLINRLGLLYARFGLLDRAEREFSKLEKANYVPALVNLGNIYLLRDQPERAAEYFSRATQADPSCTTAFLGLAKANHTMENYGASAKSFARVKELAPDVAAKNGYLDFRGEEAARAADISDMRGVMEWAEEK
jgi:tetratricopeptide (TPR) repeat protein